MTDQEKGGSPVSKHRRWIGRGIQGFTVAFLLLDGMLKVLRVDASVEGTVELGYPEGLVPWIGLTLVVSTIIYIIPRTSVLGAILLTGYLGGAVATQVRIEDPWFLFPAVFGVLAWTALYLVGDGRLRSLIPLRQKAPSSTEVSQEKQPELAP